MPQPRRVVLSLLFVTAVLTPGPAFAQEASPAAGETMACMAEPRDLDELVALWFVGEGTPAATPEMAEPVADEVDLPEGEPADDATMAAIDETTRGFVLCIEAEGKYAQGFSYATDDLAAQLGPDLSDPTQDTPEEVRALLEAQMAGTPTPGDEGTGVMPPLEGPIDARILEGGRAAAIWSFEGDQVFFVYEQQDDGRWLIDEAIDIVEDEATPAA
jgi:hypothetical protein